MQRATEERGQELTLAHFRAQLEDLRNTSLHIRAQLEHLRDTPAVEFGSNGKLKLSGKGQSKLKLSGHGNECKPLSAGCWWRRRRAGM